MTDMIGTFIENNEKYQTTLCDLTYSVKNSLFGGSYWCLKDDEYHLTVLGVIARKDGKFLLQAMSALLGDIDKDLPEDWICPDCGEEKANFIPSSK